MSLKVRTLTSASILGLPLVVGLLLIAYVGRLDVSRVDFLCGSVIAVIGGITKLGSP